jgi:type III secretory pathway lipoprotein EscJ
VHEENDSMVSLLAVTNRKAAERIQAQLRQHDIPADLQHEDPSQLVSCSPTALVYIHILVAETDLARAREILQVRLEGA